MTLEGTMEKSQQAKWVESRLDSAMASEGLDAVVAVSTENVAYVAGYSVPSQVLGVRNRFFAGVVTRTGGSAMVLSANEHREASQRAQVDRLYPYDEFNDDPVETLVEALNDLGIQIGEHRVGVELDAMPARRWMRLSTKAEESSLVDGTHCFDLARTVKSHDEIQLLRTVAQIADKAQATAHSSLRGTVSERDVARIISDAAMAHGADAVRGIQVAAGERSSLSNAAPTDRILQAGELVKVDNFFVKGGYLSDTGRSFCIGEPSTDQLANWNKIQEARLEVLASIRPGVSTQTIWRTFITAFEERHLAPAIRFLGHGLGLSLHEEPFIAAHTDTEIEEGMVLAIEPIAQVGDLKYFVEDNLVVGANGVELFTSEFGTRLPVVNLAR